MTPRIKHLALVFSAVAPALVFRPSRAQIIPVAADLTVTCPADTTFKKDGSGKKGKTNFDCGDKGDQPVFSGSVMYANVKQGTGGDKNPNLVLVFSCPPETRLNVSDRSDYYGLGASYPGFECTATNGYDVVPTGWVKNEINKWSSDIYQATPPVYANGKTTITLTVYRDGKGPAP